MPEGVNDAATVVLVLYGFHFLSFSCQNEMMLHHESCPRLK